MILISIYGKTEPTIISKKLGIGICNPKNDWIEGFSNDFDEEYMVQVHHARSYELFDSDDYSQKIKSRYDYDRIVKTLRWNEEGKESKIIIAENLVEIQVLDFEHSMLKKINPLLDSPTCEMQYAKKFMTLCMRLGWGASSWSNIPIITYDSDDLFTTPLIINYLSAQVDDKNFNVKENFKLGLSSLKQIGTKIDNFLSTDEDFWLLDYIINALSEGQQSGNAYHVFKTMSIIEMLLIKPSNSGKTEDEMERKLPQFLSDRIDSSQKQLYAKYMRRFRNKIAHGDFKKVSELLREYRSKFMKNFWYDEFEYSKDNWTYGNISLELDEALNKILRLMLNNKIEWKRLRAN